MVDLARPNPSPPLVPADVGYIELVASPDPQLERYVFELGHAKVRLGKYSTAGTYATTSDLLVAVADAPAIAAMNTMFEHLGGEFHAFDTRSPNGTFVNGAQIKRRTQLAAGDVIDLGGSPDDGGARVIFHGKTPPPGRAVLRAPALDHHEWRSPRRSLSVAIDSAKGSAEAGFALDEHDEERGAWIVLAQRVAALVSPHLPRMEVHAGAIRYLPRGPMASFPPNQPVELRRACQVAAALCEVAAVCHAAGPEPIVLGPFYRDLVWVPQDAPPVLFAAGLSRRAHLRDRGTTGPTMLALHFRSCPEEVRGRLGPTTDVFFAAYFAMELITCAEPYPTETTAYLQALLAGPTLPAGTPPILAAALAPDPASRPSLGQLAAGLRAI